MSFRSLWHFGRVKFCALTSGACLAVASATHGYAWNLEEAAKPYQGEQIRVICDGYSPCLAYQNMASSFTEITGIEVQFEIADLQSVQQKILANALTEGKAYDLVQVISWQVGVWAAQDFARPMTEFLENDELRDPNLDPNSWVQENIDQVARYNGELYGMPMQFVVPFGVFRRDIAANSSERKAFEARYGYEMPLDGRALLSEMESWNQWYDLNEFFTRDAGELLAGDT